MVLQSFTYYTILGIPVIAYLGIITLLSLLTTATMGLLLLRGKVKLKVHKAFAIITIILALIHATLALLAYL